MSLSKLRASLKCKPGMDRWSGITLLLVVNQVVAALLIGTNPHVGVLDNLIIANAIGVSIWCGYGVLELVPRLPRLAMHLIAVPIGIWIGFKLAAWLGVYDVTHLLVNPLAQWRLLLSCMVIAVAATVVISLSIRNAEYRVELAAEQQRASEARAAETDAQLALLQAQIEPHFLFNTLANVQSLIAQDPPLAQTLLGHLNGYLRASLDRTRKSVSTLADELELVSALLAIGQIRLQQRLRYRLEIPEALRGARLPPLLLQPLVENALQHGIEPALAGGEVVVSARRDGDSLCLRVADSGAGLGQSAGGAGVGLANVRARLASLYGGAGQLVLQPNSPSGVIAELTLPYREP
ncbi:sensor histidine kinase [Chitinolyticbacter meiyuanensis]|uniref:sensor histidine kinase n=1 Tax=Chitinolyticbacter meiyuanensis TaxID=682798 RepID=UPI00165218C5|nr:histidine kinase [Chitinolyticbacter meiyuanensis]